MIIAWKDKDEDAIDELSSTIDIMKAKLRALEILYNYAQGIDSTEQLIKIKEEAHRIRMLTDEEFIREVKGLDKEIS